ncbi:MAG TPA: AraC family transcriptional regulator [Buttiauxella sp.]
MHQLFTLDILRWIDDNIGQNIGVSDIVKRSGYSNAQLHRIFKSQVGCSINEYVMNKRMQKCAYALKYTNISIKALSERYHYANPQAFSRYFRSFYGVTPVDYRQNADLEFQQLFSWKHKNALELSDCQVDFIHLDDHKFIGLSGNYSFPYEQAGHSHIPHRAALENEFQIETQRPAPQLVTLCKPVKKNSSMINFEYHIGYPNDFAPIPASFSPLPSVSGDYLKFHFHTNVLHPFEMSSIAYWGFISINNIKRRDGYDIEYYNFGSTPLDIPYEFTLYIPVIFDTELIDLLLKLRS